MGEAFRPDRLAASPATESTAAWVMTYAPATDTEALKLLRGRYPDSPLSLRIAALDFLMRRGRAVARSSNDRLPHTKAFYSAQA